MDEAWLGDCVWLGENVEVSDEDFVTLGVVERLAVLLRVCEALVD